MQTRQADDGAQLERLCLLIASDIDGSIKRCSGSSNVALEQQFPFQAVQLGLVEPVTGAMSCFDRPGQRRESFFVPSSFPIRVTQRAERKALEHSCASGISCNQTLT